jgi:phage terminase large subunit-like protein
VPELLAKYFNIYQTGRMTKWITGDRIRPMQIPKTIDDCIYQEGWKVFVGCDYSHGDDLYALTYLAVNYQHKGPSMAHLMFADMEAWVLEKTMNDSPNRPLYEEWVKDGWLHVCPGEVFDPTLAINAMASHLFAPDDNGNPDEKRMRLDIHSFGYDPAQSVTSINTLKAWLQSIFTRRGMAGGDIANALKAMVVPVPQSAMVFNPIIGHLEEIILAPEPWIDFSMNPMWPWQFGNVAIEIGRSDLRRFVKGGPAASHKHDNISALGDAMYLFDLAEGRVEN